MSAKASKLLDVQAGSDLLGLALDACPEWQPKGNGLVKTHWIPPFTERRGRQEEMAICGAWVDPLADHSPEPTCEKCRAYLAADEAMGENPFGTPADVSPLPVKAEPDPVLEYQQHMRRKGWAR